jgi:hypothetical protein
MGNLQLFCQFPDGGGISAWKTFDGEESLVLTRSQPGGGGCRFTEAQELPEAIAEGSQGFVVGLGYSRGGSFSGGGHVSILSTKQPSRGCFGDRPLAKVDTAEQSKK